MDDDLETADKLVENIKGLERPSDLRKRAKHFEESRDEWKRRNAEKRTEKQVLMTRNSRLEHRLKRQQDEIWALEKNIKNAEKLLEALQNENIIKDGEIEALKKTQIIALQEASNAKRVKQHQYPILLIYLVISFLLYAIAFRAIERIFLAIKNCNIPIFEYFNFQPSWKSAQLWFLRYGLYKLTRAKEKADDWIIILDFKVQAGFQKCLIVLGVRWSTLAIKQKERGSFDVHHEDFEPIALVPMLSSNGEKVAQILAETSSKTGPFMQIVADHGTDVNKGIKLYCKDHKETVNTYDIVHKVAILLKKELEDDEVWKEILKLIKDTKQMTKQSKEVFLSPPRQREKARFMNADIMIDWLQELLFLLHNGKDVPYLDKNKLQDKFGWVFQYRDTIEEYAIMIDIIRFGRHQIRTEGLHRRSHVVFFRKMKIEFADFFEARKKDLLHSQNKKRAFKLAKSIFEFLKQEGMQVPFERTMLGSSEGIESIIGREKIIVERTKATKSITKGVLAIPAMAGKSDYFDIENALKTVSVKDLEEWEDMWIGKSDLSKRREVFDDYAESESLSFSEENSG